MRYLIPALSVLLLVKPVQATPVAAPTATQLRASVAATAKRTRDPLLRAAYFGDSATARKILKADPRSNSEQLNTARGGVLPLAAAASSGNAALVQLFLRNGARVNGRGSRGETALQAAASLRHHDVVTLLLGRGADANLADRAGATPLMRAVTAGDAAGLGLMLKNRARIDALDVAGSSALRLAARTGNAAVVRALLAGRAKPDLADKKGFSPLHAAVEAESLETIRLLLDAKAKTDPTDFNGETPLARAVRDGKTEIALLLLARGARPNVAKKDGATPLLSAAGNGDVRLVNALLTQHANIEDADNKGVTPLLAAVSHDARTGEVATTEALLKAKANVRAQLKDGTAALHLAMFPRPVPRLVEQLLGADADPQVRDNKGESALHYLVISTALLALEEDEARNLNWTTRWDEARECARLLREGGANPNIINASGQSALELLRANREATEVAGDEVAQKQYDMTIEVLTGVAPPAPK